MVVNFRIWLAKFLKSSIKNVVFELGYFIGKLSRKRVCSLYVAGVELPLDINGILYKKLDNEGMWKFELARELRSVGYTVDLNKLAE